MKKSRVMVCGAGGFIGSHLVKRLKSEGHYVLGVDKKYPDFEDTFADEFFIHNLETPIPEYLDGDIEEMYQLAADMGGAEYIFSGENDANILRNNLLININCLDFCRKNGVGKVFFSSSACVYPEHNQLSTSDPVCEESTAYPAAPDSEYGWEKLMAERIYKAYQKQYGITTVVARFHNIYGPYGTFYGGKEKAPAALCRKVIETGGEVEVLGDGKQTRSFLYIDECIDGILKLMENSVDEIVNLGSEQMVTINELARKIIKISGKNVDIRNVPNSAVVGVRILIIGA